MLNRGVDTQGVQRLFELGAFLLWPHRCIGCDRLVPKDEKLCSPCAATAIPIDQACPGCALPLAADSCLECRRRSSPLASVIAVFAYGGAITQGLLRLKHAQRRDVARPLGSLMAAALARSKSGVDALLPVPLHPRRLRTRGFNQALELLQRARQALPREPEPGARIWFDDLRRVKDTPPLGRESPQERRRRVAGAFAVVSPRRVENRTLLLVDDVMTTGATLTACADALVEAGARQVHALVLARAGA